MITLSAIPTYVDIPDTDFAVDQPVKASTLTQMAHNAKFAMVRREVFVGLFTNGETVAAPVSPIDGYQYSYAEITFWWTRNFSYDAALKKPSGSGCIYRWDDSVSSAGVVSTQTQYYVDGGADTVTNDGQLLVVLLCQRNAALKFTAVPTWADVEDADLGRGAALLASNLQQINDNIRYACVRKEFFVQTLYNGQTVALPVSPVDGYAYQMSELIFQPSMTWTVAQSGSASGGGCIRAFGCVVGGMPGVTTPAAAGDVASFVNYYINGGAYTPSTDGHVLVLIVATRAYGNPAIPPAVRVQPPAAAVNQFGAQIIALDPTATIGPGGTAMSTIDLSAVTGTQANLIPDSPMQFPNPYWPLAAGMSIGYGGGFGTGKTLVLDCAAPTTVSQPVSFPVNPGVPITLSANVAANNMTAGYALIGLNWSGRGATFYELDVAAGTAGGRYSKTFTVPAGVSEMNIYYGQWASSGNPAGTAYINQIQIEMGSAMTAYRANALDVLTAGLQSGLQVQEPSGSLSSVVLGDAHARVSATISGYAGAGLANVPDDATSARYAVLEVDANRRALIDFTQPGHVDKNLANIADDPAGVWVRPKGVNSSNQATTASVAPGAVSLVQAQTASAVSVGSTPTQVVGFRALGLSQGAALIFFAPVVEVGSSAVGITFEVTRNGVVVQTLPSFNAPANSNGPGPSVFYVDGSPSGSIAGYGVQAHTNGNIVSVSGSGTLLGLYV